MFQLIVAIVFTAMVLFSIGITGCYVLTRRELKELEKSVIRDRQTSYRSSVILAKGIELINADLENIASNSRYSPNVQVKRLTSLDGEYLDTLKKEFDFGGTE